MNNKGINSIQRSYENKLAIMLLIQQAPRTAPDLSDALNMPRAVIQNKMRQLCDQEKYLIRANDGVCIMSNGHTRTCSLYTINPDNPYPHKTLQDVEEEVERIRQNMIKKAQALATAKPIYNDNGVARTCNGNVTVVNFSKHYQTFERKQKRPEVWIGSSMGSIA